MTNANVNPAPAPIPKTKLSKKLYSLKTENNAKPSIAQLVVISGKKIPNVSYHGLLPFLINISTNWKREAITNINDTDSRISIWYGTSNK